MLPPCWLVFPTLPDSRRLTGVPVPLRPQWTALHIAAENARVDVLRYLIDQEVDINARDNDDETPMHCAAFWGHTEIVHARSFHVARVARPRGA